MASSCTPDSDGFTPRLSEEAIPTHRSGTENKNMQNQKGHVARSPPGPQSPQRSKTCGSIPTRSPSPQRKGPSPSKPTTKAGRPGSTASQKSTRPGSKTSQQRQRSPQGKRVHGGERTAANGTSETINLADPSKLLEQLANVDLTDEDTDLLLEEAYALNRKLHDELQRQEESARKNRNQRLPPLEGQAKARLDEKTKLYGHSAPLPASRPLPSRSRTSPAASSSSHSQMGVMAERRQRQRSPSGKNKQSSAGKSKKPEWDDRFSYT